MRFCHAPPRLLAAVLAVACFSGHDSKRDAAGHPRAPDRPKRSAAQEQCATAPTPITGQGIGPVRIGGRLSAIANACDTRDTAITLGEGLAERSHAIDVGGGRLVAISTGTPDTSVARIIVRDPVFRTAKGIHTGSTVAALRAAHGILCAAADAGNVIAFAPDTPGVSFETSVTPAELHGGAAAVRHDATLIPDAVTITAIWITGVPAPCLNSK